MKREGKTKWVRNGKDGKRKEQSGFMLEREVSGWFGEENSKR
jgi:hypothetical protein